MTADDRTRVDGIYKAALTVAQAEYDELVQQLAKIQQRIADLRRVINSLARMTDTEIDDVYTWEYAERHVRNTTPRPVPPQKPVRPPHAP